MQIFQALQVLSLIEDAYQLLDVVLRQVSCTFFHGARS